MDKLEQEAIRLKELLNEFGAISGFKPGNLIVFGVSSSEIAGKKIGTASNMDIAEAFVPVMREWADAAGLYIAVQGCEHINRSLAVDAECAEVYGLEPVCVVPHLKAGGAFATAAYNSFSGATMVESLLHQAHGGVDIGNTFIGMHLRRVVVPVRTGIRQIGAASVNCARTRPMLVGGERAHYV